MFILEFPKSNPKQQALNPTLCLQLRQSIYPQSKQLLKFYYSDLEEVFKFLFHNCILRQYVLQNRKFQFSLQ